MRAERLWPVAIVGVLAVTVAANVLLLWAASRPGAATVEPDYYRKAVAWDSVQAQRRHDTELAWRLRAEIGPVTHEGALVSANLVDAQWNALDGAVVAVEAIHNVADHRVDGTLAPLGRGRYAAHLPLARAGLWELRFDVRRAGQRFTATRHCDAALVSRDAVLGLDSTPGAER